MKPNNDCEAYINKNNIMANEIVKRSTMRAPVGYNDTSA